MLRGGPILFGNLIDVGFILVSSFGEIFRHHLQILAVLHFLLSCILQSFMMPFIVAFIEPKPILPLKALSPPSIEEASMGEGDACLGPWLLVH